MRQTTMHMEQHGYAILATVFAPCEVDAIIASLEAAFAADANGWTLRAADGSVYGARNLMQLWPAVIDAWKKAPLPGLMSEVLGPGYGLVRVLYFDKPPGGKASSVNSCCSPVNSVSG